MAFGDPEVRMMFPVPLVAMHLEDADALNARLLEEIAARRRDEKGLDRSNRNGWHSAYDLFRRTEPAHSELAAEIVAAVAAATAKVGAKVPAGLVPQFEGWVNVSPTFAINAPHDHPGAFWSGTYYVRVPLPEDKDDMISGSVEFLDPRGAIGTSTTIDTPFTRPKFTVRPADGTLLMWPGFMRHWVHPNQAEQDRVSIAFNSWFGRT